MAEARADGVDLLVAYSQVGGVVGALAHEAESVRTHRLDAGERDCSRPCSSGWCVSARPAGRRGAPPISPISTAPRRALTAKLATEDCGRLLLAGETSVEVAHEALITQWPWLQNTLQRGGRATCACSTG